MERTAKHAHSSTRYCLPTTNTEKRLLVLTRPLETDVTGKKLKI